MATSVAVEGLDRAVRVIRRRGARRVTLSISRATGEVTITLPPRFSMARAGAFLEDHRGWLADRLAARPRGIPFEDGMTLPYRGRTLRVVRRDGRGVRLDGERIEVGGPADALPGALERWLRDRARQRLRARSEAHAEALGVTFARLAIRDTRSRWGSCSTSGTLSYSWRVVLAPDAVLDYLAAHEVSHLREMNHSPRFWAHVAALCPDHARWQGWLRENGPDLHRYGRGGDVAETGAKA